MIGQVYKSEEDGRFHVRTLAGASGSGLPVGTIIALYTRVVPVGYLECDGSEFSTIDYPALYTILGTNKLPDLREVNLVGVGTRGSGVTNHDIYSLGQFKDDQLQYISAKANFDNVEIEVTDPGHTHEATTAVYTPTVDNLVGQEGLMGGSGNIQTVQVSEAGTIIESSTTGITAELKGDVDVNIDYTGIRTGATTHGKNVGVVYAIKANTGLTETDDEAIYGQVVTLLTDHYAQVEDLQEGDLVQYLNGKLTFVPRATINGTVLSYYKTPGSISYYNVYTIGDEAYNSDLTEATIPDGYEYEEETHIGTVYIYDDTFYSLDTDSIWRRIIGINPDGFVFDDEELDEDTIEALESITGNEVYYTTYKQEIEATSGYEWVLKGAGTVFYFETEEEFEKAKLIPIGQEGYLADGCIVVLKYKQDTLRGVDA